MLLPGREQLLISIFHYDIMIEILIEDQNPDFRQTLQKILNQESDMQVANTTATIANTLACLQQQLVDILLIDVSLYQKQSELLKAMHTISALYPSVETIFMSTVSSIELSALMVKAKVSKHFIKFLPPQKLINLIRQTYKRTAQADAPKAQVPTVSPYPFCLTPTEKRVLSLIRAGWSIAQIADELDHRLSTITVHRRNLMTKLSAYTDTSLIQTANQYQLP